MKAKTEAPNIYHAQQLVLAAARTYGKILSEERDIRSPAAHKPSPEERRVAMDRLGQLMLKTEPARNKLHRACLDYARALRGLEPSRAILIHAVDDGE